MRTRLSRSERRTDILEKARGLFARRGLAGTEMEDIRLACGISRGGLYHHFGNKRAVLDALVRAEVAHLVDLLDDKKSPPITTLLRAGSSHLGTDSGVLCGLHTQAERLDYLSCLELAQTDLLSDALSARMREYVRPDVNPAHVSELFLTINAHINRREILGEWSPEQAAGFAATALRALEPFLSDPTEFAPLIQQLSQVSTS